MIEHAYARQSKAKWYVFLETNTYFSWDTLFRVLSRLDPSEQHYIGRATPGAEDRWFAYGGAGFVLSHATLANLSLSGDERLSVKYEWMAREDCCGDAVVAYVLHFELCLRVANMYPTFSGEDPGQIVVPRRDWCTPLLSFHHVGAKQMREPWQWERFRARSEQAVTFADTLNFRLTTILAPSASSTSRWDNGADIPHVLPFFIASPSSEACFTACKRPRSCLQATHSERRCDFASALRVGIVSTNTDSMWDLKKLDRLGWTIGTAQDGEILCPKMDWLEPQIMLPPKDWAQWVGVKEWP